jgi:hypothetical protein
MRFIDGKEPNKIYTDPETGNTLCFIPSRLEDNQILMKNDPKYEQRLMLLPPHLQRALRYGDWDVFAGQVFDEFRRETHIIKPFVLGPDWIKFAAMDWGYARPYSVGWWAVNSDGRMIRYREMYGCVKDDPNKGLKRAARDVADEAWACSAPEGVNTMIADPACWSKIEEGSPSIAERFESAGWKMEKADNSRLNGLQRVHELLKTRSEDGRPMMMVFSTCYGFIRTIPTLVCDQKKPEDVDTSMEDHVFDETRYAVMSKYSLAPQLLIPRTTRKDRPKVDYDPLNHGL